MQKRDVLAFPQGDLQVCFAPPLPPARAATGEKSWGCGYGASLSLTVPLWLSQIMANGQLSLQK